MVEIFNAIKSNYCCCPLSTAQSRSPYSLQVVADYKANIKTTAQNDFL